MAITYLAINENPNSVLTTFTVSDSVGTAYYYSVNGIAYFDQTVTDAGAGEFTTSFAPHAGDVVYLAYTPNVGAGAVVSSFLLATVNNVACKHLVFTKGEDKSLLLTVFEETDGVKTRKDLTGVYLYFNLVRTLGTASIITKDNDPGGENVGVALADQTVAATKGQATISFEHDDFDAEDVGTNLPFGILVRFDPGGDDDRHYLIKGTANIEEKRVTVA
jgi:hypothetical protein